MSDDDSTKPPSLDANSEPPGHHPNCPRTGQVIEDHGGARQCTACGGVMRLPQALVVQFRDPGRIPTVPGPVIAELVITRGTRVVLDAHSETLQILSCTPIDGVSRAEVLPS